MFCQQCGTQLPDGAAFCEACGTAVASEAPTAPEVPVTETPAPPATQDGFDFNKVLESPKYHEAMMKFGFFVAAGVFALIGILMFTGWHYGSSSILGQTISHAALLYGMYPMMQVLDILFGIVCLAGGVSMAFFWAQLSGNNLGFLPMLDKALNFKLFNIVNLTLPAASLLIVLFNGDNKFGILMLLVSGAFLVFNMLYYKKNKQFFF